MRALGMVVASALALWLRIAVNPSEYSWWQLADAGALSGIGFTMSLFAGEAFPVATDFAAAKIVVFGAWCWRRRSASPCSTGRARRADGP